jgi:hypothetical protein
MVRPDQTPDPSASGNPLPPANQSTEQDSHDTRDKPGQKRRFFKLGKKKEGDKAETQQDDTMDSSSPALINPPKPITIRAFSPHRPPPVDASRHPSSPQPTFSAIGTPPGRVRSSSPRLHSPASSLIFERNVQENPLPEDVAHSIPSHIQTEDFIPPVLEASSKAITDDHLNPDEVEIVTHAAHQPAIVTVSANNAHQDSGLEPDATANGTLPFPDPDDSASSYGALDTSDIRRLSFISFADVVQAEHLEASGTRDPLLHLSMSMSPATTNRSPSPPVRSPASVVSSHFGIPSPPTSGAPSVKGVDIGSGGKTQQQRTMTGSPPLYAAGSGAQSPSLSGGELVVETMRQALRKTNSGDLSGFGHGLPLSALSLDDGHPDHPPFKP